MGFGKRLAFTVAYLVEPIVMQLMYYNPIDKILEKSFGAGGKYEGALDQTVHMNQLLYRPSLILTNGHFSVTGVRPLLPNTVEVGGMHCIPAKSLPTVSLLQIKHSKLNPNYILKIKQGLGRLGVGSKGWICLIQLGKRS
jgi:hypothetical protein